MALYQSSDGVIQHFGVNSEITLTHEHNVGLILKGNGVTACPVLTLENTNDDATAATLKFNVNNDDSAAAADVLGNIDFAGEDAGEAATTYARISGSIDDHTAGGEEGRLGFAVAEYNGTLTDGLVITGLATDGDITVDVTTHDGAAGGLMLAGTLVTSTAAELNVLDGLNRGHIIVGNASGVPTSLAEGSENQVLTIDGSGDAVWANSQGSALAGIDDQTSSNDDQITIQDDEVVINEDGDAAMDFRVEGDAETHLLFVDAGNERVSIGDSVDAPAATLEITNHATAGAYNVPLLQLNGNDVDQITVDVNAANTTANVFDITADAATSAKVINITADGLTTGAAIYVDDDSSDTGTRNVVDVIQNNAAAIAATALKVQSDGGITGINLDKNFAGTSAATVTGLNLDIDKTAATTSNNTIYGINLDIDNTTATNGTNTMIGVNITPTLTHAADAGTLTVKGAVITATGGTNGTATATGMELTSTGADTNNGLIVNCADGGTDLKILSSADTADYFTIATTTSGATTITTVDGGATAADLTFVVDGDIILNPAGNNVLPGGDNEDDLGAAGTRWRNIYTADLNLNNDRGNWTIVEEADMLTIRNNLTGKWYKLGMTEIDPTGRDEGMSTPPVS
tara:strand:+ start:942 stop:2837 length:1896 start_codon:yes stop_codon:yes gene_type:complete